MEVSGVLFRQAPCFSSRTAAINDSAISRHGRQSRSLSLKQRPNRKSLVVQFSDKAHLQYYDVNGNNNNGRSMAMKEKEKASKKKEIKKKLKLLKGLSKNLSAFSDIGFGLDPENHGLNHQVNDQATSKAVELLLGQLQTLRAEEMELKRKKKEEKAKKKAARMMMDSESSSSSSSESECEKVVDMGSLKGLKAHQETVTTSLPVLSVVPPQIVELEERATEDVGASPSVVPAQIHELAERATDVSATCCSGTITGKDFSNVRVSINGNDNLFFETDGNDNLSVGNSSLASKKIEVCMGGKCKRSGAAQLLENFQKAVGGEAAVMGCKCMGKCKDGPNVRVCNDDVASANPLSLCTGVGLEDVDLIVSNFFGGKNQNKLSSSHLDVTVSAVAAAAAAARAVATA